MFQGITHIAPSINIVFTFRIIALKALPLSDLAGYLPPYWLAPGLAMRQR